MRQSNANRGTVTKKGNTIYVLVSERKYNNEADEKRAIAEAEASGKKFYPYRNKWIPTTCRTITEAKREKTRYIDQYERERDACVSSEKSIIKEQQQPPLLLDAIQVFIDSRIDLEETTRCGYQMHLDNKIRPYFEPLQLRIDEVERSHIQNFIQFLSVNGRDDGRGGLRKNSLKKYVTLINQTFLMLLDHSEFSKFVTMKQNPCTDLRYPKEKKYEASWYTIDQLHILLKAILDTTDPEFFVGILFAILYANRRGEICGKRWSDILFDDDKILVTETRVRIGHEVIKDAKNEASTAAMPLMPFMRDILVALKERQEEFAKIYGRYYEVNDFIIKWPNGRPYDLNFLNHKLIAIEKELGLHHVTLHGLRHSAGTLLRYLGYQQSDIQSWLRHGDAKSTQIYVHDTYEFKIPTSEHLNAIFDERLDIKKAVLTLSNTGVAR